MSELPTKRRRIYTSDTKWEANPCFTAAQLSPAVQSRNATIASFKIANLFAKRRKSLEDAEVVQKMLLVVGKALFEGLSNENDTITAIKMLNLSGETLSRRIESISSDLEHQLQTDLHKCLWFSLQLDELTYMTDTSQLIVIVRMVFGDLSEKEELLKILPLKGTGGEDLFQTFRKYAKEINLPLYKLSSITTNGTLAMVDCINMLISHYRKDASLPKFVSYHCIIHQEALCAEVLQFKHIMDITTEIINAIQTVCHSDKLFKALVEDLDAEYNDHLLYTEGGWLSGKVLVKFLNLIEDIKEFLKSEDQYVEQLDNRLWLIDLAFVSDLMQKLNSLNTEFCREKSHISGMISSVNFFKGKLKLWKSHLHRKSLLHFPSMKQVVGEGDFNSKPFVDQLETLEDHFQARFQQLVVIEPLVAFLETPFQSIDVPDTAAVIGELCQAGLEEIERELVDLQSDVVLKSNSRYDNFWNLVDPLKFPFLRKAAAKIKSYFGSTYLRNSLFLAKKCIESENRAQLTKEQLHDCLRAALSSYIPNYNKLADDMECQASH
ncbi:general transcription factor II-I repeat domain-containing protein 2-like [Lacerta agilis]|uniref:general transcription factor II-I repeat domain-containing protein 2-like n=1 Tax=Lacerta agilis TaxID=80427 RepID=UPI001419273B|nr:general transcription factor II-I repeat domain-containing protein 2-like [Lacerta agilis]